MPGNPIVIYDGPSVIRQQGQMTGGGDAVSGVTISGTPTVGQVPTATSATTATWQTGGGGGGSVNSVTATDGSIVVAGTASDPTIATGTLDAIAAAHAPAANWSNNSKKITSLANGSAAQDAAAFGQIPTALPPNGAAGGDLTGTYPNPTLANAGGGAAGPTGSATVAPVVTVDAKGRVTALTSATIVPTNAAGGDLTGNYPNPTLANAGGGAAGPTGSATVAPIVTVDAKGRVTALSSATIVPTNAAGGDLTGNYPNPTIGAGKVTPQQVSWKPAAFFPPTGGVVENIPRFVCTGRAGSQLVSQTVYLASIFLPAGLIITSISWVSGTVAVGTGTHQIFGLYDLNLAKLAVTTDDTSTAWGLDTIKTLNLTPGTFTTTYNGLHYIACLVVATTVPTLVNNNGIGAGNALLTAPYFSGRYDTGQNSLPNTATLSAAQAATAYGYVS